jgi:RND family efflux transporter MFP subunit
MQNKTRWIMGGGLLALVLVAGGGGAFVFSGKSAVAKSGKKEDGAAAVVLKFQANEVARPQRVSLPAVVEFSGPLVAPGTVVVRSKAAGTLLSLDVAEGQRVRAGQALGRIDRAELDSRLAEREAALASARAQLAQAERQHQANVGLAAQNFISPTALEASRTTLDAARAQVRQVEAQLSTTTLSARDATLLAPISGIVAKRTALPGEKLSMEQAVLSIVDLTQLELAGSVGTHEVSRLQPGQAVKVQVEGLAAPITGRIARIAPAAEAGTRSIGVTVAIANPGERLRAGQYASARVQLADAPPQLTVPQGAIASASGQDYVWTLENGTLMRRTVTTGRRDAASGRVEVLQGVGEDVLVLAARFDNLREGGKAEVAGVVMPAAPAAAPAASGAGAAPAPAASR